MFPVIAARAAADCGTPARSHFVRLSVKSGHFVRSGLVAAAEANGDPVQGAGLPSFINDHSAYVTVDCIEP